MKRVVFVFLLLFILSLQYGTVYGYEIVVLGSSTAAGTGPININNAWVNRYRTYLQSLDPLNTVVNLAVGGSTTYNIMPNGYIPPIGREKFVPYIDNNITKALSLKPQAIIINMPSNDVVYLFSTAETMSNYAAIVALAKEANVPVWITTTQPCDWNNTSALESLILLKNKINDTYQAKAIDFWTTIANDDGTINSIYNSGDGVHLNDAAHAILFQRVVNAHIFNITTLNIDTAETLDSKVSISLKGDIVTVSFSLDKITGVKINIYNALGNQVCSNEITTFENGINKIQTNIKGTGLFFMKLIIGKSTITTKFLKGS